MFTPVGFWTIETAPSITPAWTGTYGRWFAGRNSGTLQRAAWSNDGITWATASTPNSYSYVGSDFSPDLGIYVAVASDAQVNNIMTSTNAVTWTARSKPNTTGVYAVKWCNQWNVFLATGINHIFTSPDGITWSIAFTHSGAVAYGGGGKSTFANTPSGYVFATYTRPTGDHTQICYSTNGTTFATYSYIQNGITFRAATQIVYLESRNRWLGIAPATDTTTIVQSTSSVSSGWTNYTEAVVTGGTRYAVAVGGSATNSTFDRFVIGNAYGQSTTAATKYSSTGASGSWTASTFPSAIHYVYAIEYAPHINQWLANKIDTTNMYSSPDGITWTTRTAFSNVTTLVWGEGVRTTGYKQGSSIT